MSTSPLSPDEIRAAAEAHAELGQEYRDAVVESFLAKIDHEISARVDARVAAATQAHRREVDPVTAARRRGLSTGLVGGLALGTIVTGLPLTALVDGGPGQSELWIIWIVIMVVYGIGVAGALAWNRGKRAATAKPQMDLPGPSSAQDGRVPRVITGHS